MKTVTIDIVNEKVMRLLQDLELLQLIRIHETKQGLPYFPNKMAQYKGAMTKQPADGIDQQLNELRDGWQ